MFHKKKITRLEEQIETLKRALSITDHFSAFSTSVFNPLLEYSGKVEYLVDGQRIMDRLDTLEQNQRELREFLGIVKVHTPAKAELKRLSGARTK